MNNINLPENNVNFLKPFTRFCLSIGMLPSSYKTSLTYEEQLLWLCDFLENTLIPTINNNGEAVTELQNLFIQLKDFVNHYFDNLDVQNEINNKLDNMAQSGELQEIIDAYLKLKTLLCFNTVDDMKNATNLIEGACIQTLGYYELNDGGQAKFKIEKINNSIVVDNFTIIPLKNPNLIARLIINEDMNVKQFGIRADGVTDNSELLRKILEKDYNSIYFPDGVYVFNSPIIFDECHYIHGQSMNDTIIRASNGFIKFESKKNRVLIENLFIQGLERTGNAIEGIFAFSKFQNIQITGFDNAIVTNFGTWIDEFINLQISYCNNGYHHNGSSLNNVSFNNCYFQHINNICFNGSGDTMLFKECNFESSNIVFSNAGRGMEIDNCYIEGNSYVFYISTAFFNSAVRMHDCWLVPKSDVNGWLISTQTIKTNDTITSPFIIENCHINNGKADTIKPFAFFGSEENRQTYIGISLFNNSYVNIKSSEPYVIYYNDLFDLTNCPNYGQMLAPTNYYTDLPLYKYEHIVWYKLDKGNRLAYGRQGRLIKMLGYIEYSEPHVATSQIQITPDKQYGTMYPQIYNIPVFVEYSDNTKAWCNMTIDTNNFYISVDKEKQVKRISFNCEYYNGFNS